MDLKKNPFKFDLVKIFSNFWNKINRLDEEET